MYLEWMVEMNCMESSKFKIFDYDNDGDLEIVVNNVNDFPFLYKNNTVELGDANYIRLKVTYENFKSEIGTKCKIYNLELYQTFYHYLMIIMNFIL